MSEYEYNDTSMRLFLYLLTAFFALGIYLVISRYNAIYNRAVPFRYRIPEVCSFLLILNFFVLIC